MTPPIAPTQTIPGTPYAVCTTWGNPTTAQLARSRDTRRPEFEAIKHLLSDRPLHRPNRTRPIEALEDQIDVASADAAMDEPGDDVDYGDARKELGL